MANLNPSQAPKPQTLIDAQLNSIDSRLKALFEIQSRIGSAVYRLVNPRPADAAKDNEAHPSQTTIEGHLQQIVRTLDNIIGGLTEQADTLDSAV